MSLAYYKRFPRDFLDGTIGMSLEEKGAYGIILDLIYMRDGRLEDNEPYISGQLGCSVRKWKTIREALISRGKIRVLDEFITNSRADKLMVEAKTYQDKQSENGKKPKKDKAVKKPPLKPEQSQTPNQSESLSEEESSLDKSKHTLSSASVADFDDFRAKYPKPDGLTAAEREWDAALDAGADPAEIMAGLDRWLAKWKRDATETRWIPNAGKWLEEKRWADSLVGVSPTREMPKWQGPNAIRDAVVKEAGEDFAASYLDPAAFQREPEQIIAANGFAADKLRGLTRLKSYKITVRTPHPHAA